MRPEKIFFFWLGSLDSRVAVGDPYVVGTHDIRFCGVGEEVRYFTGVAADRRGLWTLHLEPYAEENLPPYDLTIARYSGRRAGECALPHQFAGTGSEYQLWQRVVRAYEPEERGPNDAILLLQDDEGGYHARVIGRGHLSSLPEFLRTELSRFDECGQLIDVPSGFDLKDFPSSGRRQDPPFLLSDQTQNRETWVRRILQLPGSTGRGPTGQRYRRSRRLAEELKKLYEDNCQICSGSLPRIQKRDGRFYVEVHHLTGFAEIAPGAETEPPSQDEADLQIDRASNIVIVCPFHHMLLHHGDGGYTFDVARKVFTTASGTILPLSVNYHL